MKPLGLAALILGLGTPSLAACQSPLQDAHIEANSPAAEDFDRPLDRDLTAYFVGRGFEEPSVTFELLRDGPTQSGVSYPKYYLWVVVSSDAGVVTSGAVRVAAIDRVRFEITDYATREDIRANPEGVATIFPQALTAAIIEKAAQPLSASHGS